jgi:hypothetical protein
LVGSHLLDYTLLIPDHAARQTFLHQTGHGYFRSLMVLALAAVMLALITSMVTGYRRGRSNAGGAPRFSDWAWKLGPTQAIGFVALEFAERFAAHSTLHHYADLTISIGVLIQVIVACVGAALLVLLNRAAEHIGRARSHPVSRTRSARTWARPATLVLVPPRFARPGLVRAPPSAAA